MHAQMVAHVQFPLIKSMFFLRISCLSKHRLKRMFVGLMTFSIVVTHCQNAFAAICLSKEDDPAPRMTHFDNGFDVLFDNGANVSIGISKDDFLHLEERKGSLSGVGTATAEGVGTLHFRTYLDDGQLLELTLLTLVGN